MAILRHIHCFKCGESKQCTMGSGEYRTICHDCKRKEQEEKEAKHFAELDALPIEERLRKVEKWIYDYRPYNGPSRF